MIDGGEVRGDPDVAGFVECHGGEKHAHRVSRVLFSRRDQVEILDRSGQHAPDREYLRSEKDRKIAGSI